MPQRHATRDDVCGPVGQPGGVAPALNAVTDEQLASPLEVAALLVSLKRFGNLSMHAHANRTAHILATTPGLGLGPDGNDLALDAGPLVGESDGPSSRSLGQHSAESMPAVDAPLSTTSYGLQFLELRRAVRGYGSVMTSGGTADQWR